MATNWKSPQALRPGQAPRIEFTSYRTPIGGDARLHAGSLMYVNEDELDLIRALGEQIQLLRRYDPSQWPAVINIAVKRPIRSRVDLETEAQAFGTTAAQMPAARFMCTAGHEIASEVAWCTVCETRYGMRDAAADRNKRIERVKARSQEVMSDVDGNLYVIDRAANKAWKNGVELPPDAARSTIVRTAQTEAVDNAVPDDYDGDQGARFRGLEFD